MRKRLLIVVIGISLGLAARLGVDLYRSWQQVPTGPLPAGKAPPAKNELAVPQK